ncbi:hypothetical protein NNJEOMEG_01105 [Fundidesulfovibrio magnetotacticus]|uniref:Uncharacterized protein n=1 Tax=Fundidesulfovibrio magnetotacticus TaxID=2730080 RepID=A0A6V8LNL7_9BACT|nr:hypothetical protein [Fundidesulfovibrio magnetotacticus]GFK93274.1 hypothetical protein NNJEOMEG_01105 [Fundidesulfovibrio magnetotacticus]
MLFFVRVLIVAACLALPSLAMAQAKHFAASQRHFEDLANKAADLSASMDNPGEKNLCNYYTATAMLYALRAHALAQLAAVEERLRQPEDLALVRAKIVETKNVAARHLTNDLKALESLAASSENSRIHDLGMRLVNEVRVFSHNADTAARQ